ncbi:hypothetical protein GCM10026983_31800 [Gracilibacillus alcaliphilus]
MVSTKPPARLLYEAKGPDNETITFQVYGEYEEAPKLNGDNIREEKRIYYKLMYKYILISLPFLKKLNLSIPKASLFRLK